LPAGVSFLWSLPEISKFACFKTTHNRQDMRVFKFGGASVKDSASVRNVASIIHKYGQGPLVVVVSAMDKTTNALEQLTALFMAGRKEEMLSLYQKIKSFHLGIASELFPNPKHQIFSVLEQSFYHLLYYIKEAAGSNYNYEYDRIVSSGEMISTQIISFYLKEAGLPNQLFPAQKLIITDARFRDARVDWIQTPQTVKSKLGPYLFPEQAGNKPQLIVTQGFIGGTSQGFTTTLGREGSDYSAAILAYSLDATEVTIWKDVPGLLNADPKIMEQTMLLEGISYQEAIELAYYGATVIHPKTLKPLLSKSIPLKVKSFAAPAAAGTIIDSHSAKDNLLPSYIFKFNQVLASIFPRDFSFIAEDNLSRIFSDFASHGVKINLMQNSAISFSVCFDKDVTKTPALLKDLSKNFQVKYNDNLQLITVRHYEKASTEHLIRGREVLLEQKSRTTLQMVVK
jgi:aspartate kinase